MRMPRSDAPARSAIAAAVTAPAAMCVNTSSSIAPLSASVSWNAQRASRTMPGSGGGNAVATKQSRSDAGRRRDVQRLTHGRRRFGDRVAPRVDDPSQADERMDHPLVAFEHDRHAGALQLARRTPRPDRAADRTPPVMTIAAGRPPQIARVPRRRVRRCRSAFVAKYWSANQSINSRVRKWSFPYSRIDGVACSVKSVTG